MKQIRSILLLFIVVSLSFSVTSCLKGDDDNTIFGGGYVKVNKYDMPITFTDVSGIKLIPTEHILSADEDMAIIYYTYNPDDVDQVSNSVTVKLYSAPAYIKTENVNISSVEGNASFVTLSFDMYRDGILPGGLFDKNTLILPFAYKSKKYSAKEEHDKEQSLHSFTMTCDLEEDFDGQRLTLHFHHRIESTGTTVNRTDDFVAYKAFDLSDILSKLSGVPNSIVIKVKENENSDDLSTATDKTYEFNYANFK